MNKKNDNGEEIRVPLDGQGCLVPVVTCPNPAIGDRCELGRCGDCENYVQDEGTHFIICKFGDKVASDKKAKKKPTAVFTE